MKSKSAFLRRQILYGFVYDIDYLFSFFVKDGREGQVMFRKKQKLYICKKRKIRNGYTHQGCKRGKGTDEKSVGYTKSHALKTAIHETVNRIKISATKRNSSSQSETARLVLYIQYKR